jgi:hypothetical protein
LWYELSLIKKKKRFKAPDGFQKHDPKYYSLRPKNYCF